MAFWDDFEGLTIFHLTPLATIGSVINELLTKFYDFATPFNKGKLKEGLVLVLTNVIFSWKTSIEKYIVQNN